MHPKKATEEESPAADHKGGKPVPGQAFSDKKRQTSLNARIAVEQISRATTQADYSSRFSSRGADAGVEGKTISRAWIDFYYSLDKEDDTVLPAAMSTINSH